jgi:hypothetical protein
MSEEDKIILIRITLPVVAYIALLICIHLKIFRMVITILPAAIVALFEKLDRRYEKAAKEIE